MKKRIISFFAMALLFAGAVNAQFEELGDKTVGVREEVLTMDQIVPETQWYAVYQARPYGGYTGGYWWDKGAGETLYKSAGTEMLQMTYGADAAPYVVRFLTTETEGVYNVQFGTGNYFASDVTSTADVANAAQIRMYNIMDTEGHWAFNLVNNGDQIMDNNGSGNTLAPWESGDVTKLNGNNDHKIYVVRELSESEMMPLKAAKILADVEQKIELAKAIEDYDLGEAQIANVGQFSSPYTDPGEGSIDALIDGNAASYWHSNWHDGNQPNGTHYLQVELAQSLEAAAFTFSRRPSNNDHVTQWSVYGTNDSEAEKDACTLLATINTPYGSNTETLTSAAIRVGDYQYLRFYAEATTTGRGYFHLAEFQLYEAVNLAETLAEKMGAVFTNMEAAVAAAKAEETISAETCAALESAYEVFCKVYEYPFFGGNYYLKNVESGKYLGAANSWGTQASLVEHGEHVTLALLPDGAFSLESRVNNGGTQYYLGANGFMDNGEAMPLTFVANGEYFTIKGAESFIGYDGTSSVLALNLAADAPGALWQVISEADMLASLATATAEAPVDATFLIKDHDFSRNHRDKGAWVVDASNKNLAGGDETNTCAESYHSVFNIGQTLNVPNGVYALTAQGFYRQDGEDNENLPVFYANDATAQFPLLTGNENSMNEASVSFSNGAYTINPIFVEVTDGTLNIGVKLENNVSLWCIWDHFVLKYYGNVDMDDVLLKEYEARYNAALKNANETVALNLKISIASKTALQEVIDANTGLTSAAGHEALLAAAIALEDAVTTANLAAKNYEDIKSALDKFVNLPSFDHIVKFTYRDAIEKGYNEGTLSDDNSELTKFRDEYRKYLQAIQKEYRNANALGNNIDISQTGAPPTNWFAIENTPNKGTITVDNEDSGGLKNIFENWKGDGLSVGNMYTTVTGLPNGKYFLRAQAATSHSTTKDYVYIKSGDNEETGVLLSQAVNGAWICITEPIEVTNGTVELGLHVGSGDSWAQIGVVELKVYEIYDQTATNEVADNVQYGTISLPYAATTEANLYTVDALNGNLLVMTEVADGKLEAGKAYIYEGISATFSYVPEQNLTNTAEATGLLTGVLKPQTIAADNYVLQTQNGHKAFYRVVAGKEITGVLYRAYLTKPASAAVRDVLEFGDDTVTALDAIEALQNGKAEIYDVNGRKLQKLQKGVNIVNGAKIIVK